MIKYSGEATPIQRDDSDGPANEASDNATGPEHQCNYLRPINCWVTLRSKRRHLVID